MKITMILPVLAIFVASIDSIGASKPKILFTRKAGPSFTQVAEGMKKEFGERYDIVDFVIDKDTPYDEFQEKMAEGKPVLAVQMDNQAVDFLLKWNRAQPDPKHRVKGLGLMGLNLKEVLKKDSHVSGIAYESPAYTLIVNYRFVSELPIKSVVVFYRKSVFGERIATASAELKNEGIALRAINVEANGASDEAIERFMRENVGKETGNSQKYDAVWVMLDSALLSPKLFREVWVPASQASKLPFVTETESLVSVDLNFATFAITPNLPEMASQAVQLAETMLADDAVPAKTMVEQVIAVDKVINMRKAERLQLKLKKNKLSEVKQLQ